MQFKQWKQKAKKVISYHYFRTVFVCFLCMVILGGGYHYITIHMEETVPTIEAVSSTPLEFVDQALNPNPEESTHISRGFLAVLNNKIRATDSVILGILQTIDHFLFRGGIPSIFLLCIGILLYILYHIFIRNPFMVGQNRYFLEKTKYKDTPSDRIFFPYRSKKTSNIIKTMLLRNLYQFAWDFTIVGIVTKRYSYRLVPYILAENPSIAPKDAIKLSEELMYGKRWKAFLLDLSLLGWSFLGILTFSLSDIFFFSPYKNAVYAEFYKTMRMQGKEGKIKNAELLKDNVLEGELVDDSYPLSKYFLPFRNHSKWLKINYKRNYSISSLILIFFTVAMVGWLWEVLLHLFTSGTFVNKGTRFGPWLPIYGYGAVLTLLLLKPARNKMWLTFILSMLVCGTIEYATAWYLETFEHMKWWDYSGFFLNLQGRICLEGLLVFGLGCSINIYVISPLLDNLYQKINPKVKKILCVILVSCFLIDTICSYIKPNQGNGITIGADETLIEKPNFNSGSS